MIDPPFLSATWFFRIMAPLACVQPSRFTTTSFPRSLSPRPAPQTEKRGETLGTTTALLISNKFSTLPKSFRNDFHSATSSFHPHIYLLCFSTKMVGKEAKVYRIITRYHEVARRRLWLVVVAVEVAKRLVVVMYHPAKKQEKCVVLCTWLCSRGRGKVLDKNKINSVQRNIQKLKWQE